MKPPQNIQDREAFRDKITTVEKGGQRKWIYALKPVGRLYDYRKYLSYFYFILIISLPFIKWHGNPIFLLDVVHGKFVLFGRLFLPQDFILFGLAMLAFLLFIIIFTLAYGRVFCGWVCPQTIFMEMLFRRIEYWIEGSATHQMKSKDFNYDGKTLFRKILKHVVFFILAFGIANLFLSYIIGVEALFKIISEPLKDHTVGFFSLIFFSVLFYFVYAFVRELVCTVVCPYGRLQSVLLDQNSIVVAYDYVRGEPRTKDRKNKTSPAGDCIDCGLCVQVCPTGIDIRNGTQMECTNCTACIDACNLMMHKVGRPEDLIRFASANNIKTGTKPRFTYRIATYTAVLALLLVAMGFVWMDRKDLDITVMRVPGQILQKNADGTVSNLYRIKLINTAETPQVFRLKLQEGIYATLEYAGHPLDTIHPGQSAEELFFIKIPQNQIKSRKQDIEIDIFSGTKKVYGKQISFIGLTQ